MSRVSNVRNLSNVTEAYFDRDQSTGTIGFVFSAADQSLDSVIIGSDGLTKPAKVYIADLSEEYAFSIYITDPQADVLVEQWKEEGDMPIIGLTVEEQASDHQILHMSDHVNGGGPPKPLSKLIIVVTSPRADATFSFILMGVPIGPT